MADIQRSGFAERDIDQAITALKKGAYLLKYGRRGKPKFCPFQLSNDETTLVWYSGREEKQLKLNQVSKIIPGQRTAIFHRYPRPEKEYQSFSLIYHERSLDLICKDKDEAEVWFVGLKALISRGNHNRKWRNETRSETASTDGHSPQICTRKNSPTIAPIDIGPGDGQGIQVPLEKISQNRLGKAFCDIISYTAAAKSPNQAESVTSPLNSLTAGRVDISNGRSPAGDTVRVSLSSAVSSSSHGSCHEDFDALGDVFIWGEGVGDGVLGGCVRKTGNLCSSKADAFLPKALESTIVLDVHNIACGVRHAVLVTKQGEIFSWGKELGGRLGHGLEADVPQPKLIETLSGMNIELVACGEYHTCAVTLSGDLYTWGDSTHNSGVLGHGSEASHWIPKRVSGDMEGIRVSHISCGPWHTAAVTSTGQLFTFGDGTFGALGHGDHRSVIVPREVEALRGQKTIKVACGIWHTAAVVEITVKSSRSQGSINSSCLKLFTWGDGDKGRLGHGDNKPRLIPKCVAALSDENVCQVACGNDLTVALTSAGRVYTMGSNAYGQLGNPTADGKAPILVEGNIAESIVEEIACGSHHIVVLTSKSEVYTWGRGTNGQLGHGDNKEKSKPTLVYFLKDKQVKTVACGSNFTAILCLHKWVSSADHSVCSGCRNPFGLRRKRHNCYNCGLVFCKACSSRKCLKASLAPNMNKPYRVCDDCFHKLKKVAESASVVRITRPRTGNMHHKANEIADRETMGLNLHAQLSRIPSTESTNHAESRRFKDTGLESDNSRLFPVVNGKLQLGDFHPSKISSFLIGSTKKVSPNSSPVSTTTSQTTALLRKKSPSQASEVVLGDSRRMNGSLSEEISSLRKQVEDLTFKSKRLEVELHKKSRQLKEVTAIATDEAEKCKSAKEVIMSLTAQLKEIAARLPEGHGANHYSNTIEKQDFNARNISPSESHSTSAPSGESESNSNSLDHQMLPNGTKSQTEKPPLVVQAEPGVYITLSSLPGGGNELKRVRFSRKHFTEQQAEKWWAENGSRVCKQHSIQNAV